MLTAWAATGLAVVMVLAAGHHGMRGESPVMNAVLLALAALVAWGRFKVAPINSRG